MVTLLIVIGLIGGTCALIWGMVMIAMMLGKKSKKSAHADAAMPSPNKVSTSPSSPVMPSPAIKRVHT